VVGEAGRSNTSCLACQTFGGSVIWILVVVDDECNVNMAM
jgi:hypothetical protein